MRIAIIVPSLENKGPIRVAAELANGLSQLGHEIHIFYFNITSRGLEIDAPKTRITLFEQIRLNEFDIIHSHGLIPDLYVFLHSFGKNSVMRVSTMHNMMYDDLKYTYGAIIAFFASTFWKCSLARHHALVVLNNQMLSYYEVYTSKLTIIKNGLSLIENTSINKNKLQELDEINFIKKNYKIIGVVASLIKRKGIDQALQALLKLENHYLFILGDGPEYNTLVEMSKKIGVDNRVKFLGYVPNPKDYYGYFDIYLLTSLSEGLPLSIIDAAGLGIPIVSSRIPAMIDSFRDSEIFFYDLWDIKSLTSAILETEKNHKYLSKNIQKKYSNEFTAKTMCINYARLYAKLLEIR
jgi:glycosyltransferase involved in cell wall biosynthesis